jgi:hypothetical protein
MTFREGRDFPAWRFFALGAIGSAVGFGFVAGTLVFAAPLFAISPSRIAQLVSLHGHVQLYGFVLALTIGVAYWFLPRLWGRPQRGVPWLVGMFLFSGLLLRVFGSILDRPRLALVGGGLEFVAFVQAGWDLTRSVVQAPLAGKARDPALVVGVIVAVVALPMGLAADLCAMVGICSSGRVVSVLVGFYGAAVPIALAMTGRLFPLYFRTRAPHRRYLAWTLMVTTGGLWWRVGAFVAEWSYGVRFGCALQGAGLVGAIVAMRLLEPRQVRPAAKRSLWQDPYAWLAALAYTALGADALLLLGATFRGVLPAPALEWHLVGVGYLMVLITAVGPLLLAGFAGERTGATWPGWVILGSVLMTASWRIGAALAPGEAARWAGAAAGLIGATTVLLFAWHARILSLRRSRRAL